MCVCEKKKDAVALLILYNCAADFFFITMKNLGTTDLFSLLFWSVFKIHKLEME